MKRRFVTLDVFTDRRFAGNPLAVVLEAEGLDQTAMQAIALEFNLSETVFILPAEQAAHRARYRIFTPRRELPFAGHPTVGTAVLLARLDGGGQARDMILEANIGPVACRVSLAEGHASFDLPALPAEIAAPSTAPAPAAALGLSIGDIGLGSFAPCCWSAGVPYAFVPLKSLDAVRRAKPDLARFAALDGPQSIFVFTDETAEPGHHYHARMFAPSFGIVEDPATGSAAAAFAGVLCRFGGLKDGSHAFTIEQGYEMGRPSLMQLRLTRTGGMLTAASIGGHAVNVSEGTIEA
ncbi:MAG TPA: PhzF family phenazine biosynthesis protein [Pseudolabrys sp.]|nr:PhzF family phenazine biosynthesis protein [Pseudolabrys sp.]